MWEGIGYLCLHSVDEGAVLGDLEETFQALAERYGRKEAVRWYRSQILRSAPYFIIRSVSWSLVMIRNYIRVALRSFRRYAGYSMINLSGLVAGLACVLLIGVYLRHELTYDRFHADADRIHRVVLDLTSPGGLNRLPVTPGALAGLLSDRVPEIERTIRLYTPQQMNVRVGNTVLRETSAYYADETFGDVFTVDVMSGDSNGMLSAPGSVVLTEETARRYFGTTDVVGRRLTVADSLEARVTAVVRALPTNSHFRFNALISMETMKSYFPDIDERWSPHMFLTYALVAPGAAPGRIEERLPEYVSEAVTLSAGYGFEFRFQPITDIYLRSDRTGEPGNTSSMERVTLFGAVAVFVLLVACLNFMNLSTARSSVRVREVGMRKVLGARRRQLIAQFAGEALLYATASAALAWVVAWAVFPLFRSISGVAIGRSALLGHSVIASLVGVALIAGLAAGLYPAFVLSAARPIPALRSSSASGGGALVRKVLVVGQFAVSMFLIVGTIVVLRQIEYMRNRDLGFAQDQIVVLAGLSARERAVADRFRDETTSIAAVRAVGTSDSVPGRSLIGFSYHVDTMPAGEFEPIPVMFADPMFDEVYGVELLAGRNFSAEFGDDSTMTFLMNRAAALQSGWQPDEAVGKEVAMTRGSGTVAGVVEDFHFNSLHESIRPMLILSDPVPYGTAPLLISVRLTAADVPSVLAELEQVWTDVTGDLPFEYYFLDEEFDRQYRADERLARLMTVFGSIAILIACLGLFGLATLTAERRRREIGIRKVLGAGVAELAGAFTIDFLKLVAIAFVIAAPLTWLAADRWLRGFAYRIDVGPVSFIAGGLALALLAALTVSYHSVRAATANPVDALRSE